MLSKMRSLAMAGVMLVAGCAGIGAREAVLGPALAVMYVRTIHPLVERGAEAATENPEELLVRALQVGDALDGGDRRLAQELWSSAWPWMRQAAVIGLSEMVSAGEISPAMAELKMLAIEDFESGMAKFLERLE